VEEKVEKNQHELRIISKKNFLQNLAKKAQAHKKFPTTLIKPSSEQFYNLKKKIIIIIII